VTPGAGEQIAGSHYFCVAAAHQVDELRIQKPISGDSHRTITMPSLIDEIRIGLNNCGAAFLTHQSLHVVHGSGCLYHGHLQVPGACVGGNVTSGSEVISLRTRGTEIERRLLGKSAGTEGNGE
jgi:hypothetical protein